MKNLKYILLTTIIILTNLQLFSVEQENMEIKSFSLHIRITEMTESEPPFVSGENIVFSYKPTKESVRHVGIAFENENFSTIHNLMRNENGIYFYLYKYPKERLINYRFIEDGVWLLDENSSKTFTDKNFIQLSTFEVPEKNIKEHLSPIINENKVTFMFSGDPNTSVYVTGDFNNWNPFLHRMKEESPGEYSITLNIPKGKFGYYFIYQGSRVLDAENPLRGISRINESVSLFTID